MGAFGKIRLVKKLKKDFDETNSENSLDLKAQYGSVGGYSSSCSESSIATQDTVNNKGKQENMYEFSAIKMISKNLLVTH